jgi:hypothetical protein
MVAITQHVSKTAPIKVRQHFVGEMLCFSVESEKNQCVRHVVED